MNDQRETENPEHQIRSEELKARGIPREEGESARYEDGEFRRATIERAAEGICVCHAVPEHPYVRFTIWNERMVTISGYSMEEINQRGWYQSVYPDPEHQARARERMDRMREGDDLISEEWEITRKDGEHRFVRISTSLLETEDGVSHVLALMHDVTNERRARRALQKAHSEMEERVKRRTAELAEANQNLQREISERIRAEQRTDATTYRLKVITQLQQQFLVESDPRQSFERMLALVLESTESEYGFLGEIKHNPDGRPFLKTHALTNISWDQESDNFYRQHAPTGLEFHNMNTLFGAAITAREVVIANDAHDPRRRGLPEGHPPVHTFMAIPLFYSDGLIGLVGVANRPGGYSIELVREMDPILATCSALVYSFRLECLRREAEQQRLDLERQLLHSQRLESLGLMAGSLAHDFNNMLTGILGYGDLACLELKADSPARQAISSAMDCARRATDLTYQLLAFSGKGRFVVEPLNLTELVNEMIPLMKASITKKCRLKFNLMPDLPSVEGDATQIRQVVLNLVLNAAEAIGAGEGNIELSTGVVESDPASLGEGDLDFGLPSGLVAFLEVADEGHGISTEVRERMFEPFFSTKFTGRGLGLSAVLGIVRGHHGAIKCMSEPGKGARFRILFGAKASLPRVQDVLASESREWRGTGTVLVVEDEASIRSLVKTMLEAMGFAVVTACDGREGVEVFRSDEERIRLVFLDMTMPELNGEEALRAIRMIRPDVRVLLTSGFSEEEIKKCIRDSSLTGFIQKPYLLSVLRAAVRTLLGAEGD